MALTMTRNRTQTALTRLARLLANLNGELQTVERLLGEHPQHTARLEGRQQTLLAKLQAVRLTLQQFDPELDLARIGTLDDWQAAYGRRGNRALARYLELCVSEPTNLC